MEKQAGRLKISFQACIRRGIQSKKPKTTGLKEQNVLPGLLGKIKGKKLNKLGGIATSQMKFFSIGLFGTFEVFSAGRFFRGQMLMGISRRLFSATKNPSGDGENFSGFGGFFLLAEDQCVDIVRDI